MREQQSHPVVLIGLIALVIALIPAIETAYAQYEELWTIQSPDGEREGRFHLGDKDLSAPMLIQYGSGRTDGSTSHSALNLIWPDESLYRNTAYSNTDADQQIEFISDSWPELLLVVWDGLSGTQEATIPYSWGTHNVQYILPMDVTGDGISEILVYWEHSSGSPYGTTCFRYGGTVNAGEGVLVVPSATVRQNAPNPFNPRTTLSFALDTDGQVDLRVFDVSGRRVRQLVSDHMQGGEYVVEWDGRDDSGNELASGTYFYELRVDGRSAGSQKAVLLK
jgi:hypothetical protein